MYSIRYLLMPRYLAQLLAAGVTPLSNATVIYTSDKGYKRNGSQSNAAKYDDRFTTELNGGVLRGIVLRRGSGERSDHVAPGQRDGNTTSEGFHQPA